MSKNPKVVEFLKTLSESEKNDLAYAALAIGFHFGQNYDPPMTTAAMAFHSLDYVTSTLEMQLPDGLHLNHEETQWANNWRRIFGEPLLDDELRLDTWGLSVSSPHPGADDELNLTGLTLDEATETARKWIAERCPEATEDELDDFKIKLDVREVVPDFHGFYASIEDHGEGE